MALTAAEKMKRYRARRKHDANRTEGVQTDPEDYFAEPVGETTAGLWDAFAAGYAARITEELRAGQTAPEQAVRDWIAGDPPAIWMLQAWLARSGRFAQFEELSLSRSEAAEG